MEPNSVTIKQKSRKLSDQGISMRLERGENNIASNLKNQYIEA